MRKEKDFGNIKIYVEDSYEEMGIKAAEIMAKELNNNPHGVYGFATGSTPLSTYKALINKYNTGTDFSGITTFNLDEYYPIKKTNDQSYDYFMRENLFNHINVKQENIHIPNGEALDPEEECISYEAKIRNVDGIDLQILGIGANGHIGFNEPASCFSSKTNYISLTESTISANARFFASEEDVPKHALTMGIKTIMNARKILLLVNGEKKNEILRDALFGDITPALPASILQLHPDVSVVIDSEAASSLEGYL